MAWVKRGGGAGTGMYSQGLPPADAADERKPADQPNAREAGSPHRDAATEEHAKDAEPAPAYKVTEHRQVVSNRVILDVLAGCVSDGGDPAMSMLYEDALEAFGPGSMHFIAACKGNVGAGVHYQRTVAGGRFRD